MSGQDNSGEKSHDPTPKKLEDARREGNIARSSGISAAAGYLGLLLALVLTGPAMIEAAGGTLSSFFSRAAQLQGVALGPGGGRVVGAILGPVLLALAPVFILPFLLAALSIIAQRGFVFAPGKLKPKLSRISPISVAKNKFGPTGLFEFAKSVVKMIAVATAVAVYLSGRIDIIVGSARAPAGALAGMIGHDVVALLKAISLIAVVIAAIDYLWQRYDHARKLRMSYQDLKDEHKQSEGDPHFKNLRRARAQEIASNRMLLDVPGADVVIVNPSHVAVALAWSRDKGSAPTCVAKGCDEIAARIREIATEVVVPIHSDPPTARALHATVKIGEEVDPKHYQAVAAAIRFAEEMRQRAAKGALARD